MRNLRGVVACALLILVCAGCSQKSDTSSDSSLTPPGATPGQVGPPAELAGPAARPPQAPAPAKPLTDAENPALVHKGEKVITAASGLKYVEIKAGKGAAAKPGDTVSVHYTGWTQDGQKFDSSRDRGEPFSFSLGQGQVIKGWDEGVAGMKVGERRKLIIPSEMGYGAAGMPPKIPPDATLTFDVELLGIQ